MVWAWKKHVDWCRVVENHEQKSKKKSAIRTPQHHETTIVYRLTALAVDSSFHLEE